MVKADDLIQLKERGRGAYGVVYEMQHRETGTIMAVKVPNICTVLHLCSSSIRCHEISFKHPLYYPLSR